MKKRICQTLKWLLPLVGVLVFGMIVLLSYSIESSHIVKKDITYDHGQLKQIMIYDSSSHNLNAQAKVSVRLETQYDFYDLLD